MWQLLFPPQPGGNHDGETRLRPPLEENETKSKHNSPEGEIEERRRRKYKEEGSDRDRKRQQRKKRTESYKVCEEGRREERLAEREEWECEQNMRDGEESEDKLKHEKEVMELVLTDLSCGMRRKTASDTLQ